VYWVTINWGRGARRSYVVLLEKSLELRARKADKDVAM
jgi:hypothetical protein